MCDLFAIIFKEVSSKHYLSLKLVRGDVLCGCLCFCLVTWLLCLQGGGVVWLCVCSMEMCMTVM